jgi:hypothetical protein
MEDLPEPTAVDFEHLDRQTMHEGMRPPGRQPALQPGQLAE